MSDHIAGQSRWPFGVNAYSSRPLAPTLRSRMAVSDQQVQTVGEHRARNAKVVTEVTEAADAVERIAHDQQGPPFPDDLQRAG